MDWLENGKIFIDGEECKGESFAYYDSPLDYYIDEKKLYLRFLNAKRSRWVAFKGGRELIDMTWEEIIKDKTEFEIYANEEDWCKFKFHSKGDINYVESFF